MFKYISDIVLQIAKEHTVESTIFFGVCGYLFAYFKSIKLDARKARLKFISDLIQFLYGPLYAMSHASSEAWSAFRSKNRPGGAYFDSARPMSKDDLAKWRLWMSEVFMPINLKMEKTIIENTHLVEGDDLPDCFLSLLAHVETYRVTIKSWELGDYSEHTAFLNYPSNIHREIEDSFKNLCIEQGRLMGRKI